MDREELTQKARALREAGWTYSAIGKELGFSYNTVRRWIHPDIYQKDLDYNKQRRETHGETYRKNYRESKNGRGRIVGLLSVGACSAKKRGHEPCNADPDYLLTTLVDKCQMCGKNERDERTHLCLDHDHTTGEFRGWLCHECNKGLGYYEKYKDLSERYLNEQAT